MPNKNVPHNSAVPRVYLIVGLFVSIILCFVVIIQVQMDALTAIRAFVGGEGLWAKAQKDAVRSLEHYAASQNEADYQTYLRLIRVPLGDRIARIEMQKDKPDVQLAFSALIQGRNHPDDLGPAFRLFRRFQHSAYMSKVIEHWTAGDRLIAEMNGVADELHAAITAGQINPKAIRSLLARLEAINRQVTEEEDQFSFTMSEASRWANSVARNLTYAIAFIFVLIGVVPSWLIIARIHATENALHESEERYRSIFERVDDIIYTIEADGTFSSISPSIEKLLGWQPGDWVGRTFDGIVHPDDLQRMRELFLYAQAGNPLPVFQVRVLAKSGGYLDAEIVANPMLRRGVATIIGVVRDITERKKNENEIRLLAATDSLTGITNRREFTSVLEYELARAKRYGTPLALVMYDLDYFKEVNDTFGHNAGDQVLRNVSGLIRNNIRTTDVQARWGGEEFMILMPQTDILAARNSAEKLRVEIADHRFEHDGSISASFGVTEFAAPDDINSLIKRVDDALYNAKRRGRNCVETL